MRRMEYRITFSEGEQIIVTVTARSVDSGFPKALRIARKGVPASWGDLHSIEFWRVAS